VKGVDLDRFDRDGALAEARGGLSRAAFLAAAGTGALLALAPGARAAGLSKNDASVLNYALSLEYLQAAFYTESERSKALTGRALEAAAQVGAVERAHVKAFHALLGKKAIKRPRFDFQGVTEDPKAFLKTAVAFEDLAVEAYKGQAPRLESKEVLAAALGIHTVEARHAAWMRYLNGITPAAAAFDDPRPKEEIDRIVRATGFVSARPKMAAQRAPRFTG
jgi:Ferritin-like domain